MLLSDVKSKGVVPFFELSIGDLYESRPWTSFFTLPFRGEGAPAIGHPGPTRFIIKTKGCFWGAFDLGRTLKIDPSSCLCCIDTPIGSLH